MEDQKHNIDQYIEDIKLIKDTLNEREGISIIETWAFYTWSFFILSGTIISYMIGRNFDLTQRQIFIVVWLPHLFLGGICETVAWVRRMSNLSSAYFTRIMQRFLLGYGVALVGLMVMTYFLLDTTSPVPGLLVIMISIMICVLAQQTFNELMLEGLITFSLGIFFSFAGFTDQWAYIGSGIFTAVLFLILGIHYNKLEKKYGV